MAPGGTSARVRHRKVNVKTQLQVVRELELPEDERQHLHLIANEGDGLDSGAKVETGVDREEEKEHHLQAVINASAAAAKGGSAAQLFIPTPDAVRSDVPYNDLYPRGAFAQPATYIRFSSTVEDCTGVSYCMDERDEDHLRSLNESADALRDKFGQCEEDQFESVMNSFEETSTTRQPYANLDGTPVLSLEEMKTAFDDSIDEVSRAYAGDIYRYWKSRRTERDMRSIIPRVKTVNMDRADNVDDSDPYFCFRRRETRQVRKTRGRDAQIIEKLKKLRKELEEGRQLLHWVKNREEGRREDLRLSRQIYEQRASVREMKRTLDIRDDDEDLLIVQKTPKRRLVEVPPGNRPNPSLRRQDSLSMPDHDMRYFDKVLEQRHRETMELIQAKLKTFALRNADFVDRTQDFLQGIWAPTDELEDRPMSQWVGIDIQDIPLWPRQELTPPASINGDSSGEEGVPNKDDKTIFRWVTPPGSASASPEGPGRLYVRQRRGRGGRLMLDRRVVKGRNDSRRNTDSWKYDQESGDDEEDDGHDHVDDTDVKWFRLKQHLENVQKLQRAAAGMGPPRAAPRSGGPSNSLAQSRIRMT